MHSSILATLIGGAGSSDPLSELREELVRSLLPFVEGIRLLADSVVDLRATIDVVSATPENEFALATWRALLPDIRRLRDELNAVERALAPPPAPATFKPKGKKNRRTH